jgi:hypothetical protein
MKLMTSAHLVFLVIISIDGAIAAAADADAPPASLKNRHWNVNREARNAPVRPPDDHIFMRLSNRGTIRIASV